MNKREFLKKSSLIGLGGIAMATTPVSVYGSGFIKGGEERFKFPKLSYAYDALEPYIDAQTMELHHSKHHAGYTKKFNAALADVDIGKKKAEQIIAELNIMPEDKKTAIRNNGGGYVNHKLFWTILSPKGGGAPSGDLQKVMHEKWGDFDKFKEEFNTAAKTRFGSGWAWLVVNPDKTIEIMSTANQDSPLSVGKTPILGLDVWEHAYYLKYQNKRPDYVEAFWNLVNWEEVGKRYSEAVK